MYRAVAFAGRPGRNPIYGMDFVVGIQSLFSNEAEHRSVRLAGFGMWHWAAMRAASDYNAAIPSLPCNHAVAQKEDNMVPTPRKPKSKPGHGSERPCLRLGKWSTWLRPRMCYTSGLPEKQSQPNIEMPWICASGQRSSTHGDWDTKCMRHTVVRLAIEGQLLKR